MTLINIDFTALLSLACFPSSYQPIQKYVIDDNYKVSNEKVFDTSSNSGFVCVLINNSLTYGWAHTILTSHIGENNGTMNSPHFQQAYLCFILKAASK